MNQMMAPSMPNIAHSSGYASNISASQSMQNVNMINANHPNGGSSYSQHSIGAPYGHPGQTVNQPGHMSSATSHPHIFHGQDMQQMQQQHQHLQQQQQQQNHSTLLRGQGKMSDMNEMLKRRHQRQQEMMPMHSLDGTLSSTAPMANSSPLSPVKTLPPTAPKPQVR